MADVNGASKPNGRQHWITGVSVVTCFGAFFWAGMQWQTVQSHDRALDRLDIRIMALERDHAGAIPALRKLEADYEQMKQELQRLRWRLGEERQGPR